MTESAKSRDEDFVIKHSNVHVSLSKKISTLENENENLKNKNDALKSRIEKLLKFIDDKMQMKFNED